jgi:hypothetical protein
MEKCDLISHQFICCIICPTVFTQIVFVIDYYNFFSPNAITCPYRLRGPPPLLVVAEV